MCKNNLWVVDKDSCPDDDVVIMQGHCKGCEYYRGFKLDFGQPCVVCSFYASEHDKDKK